MLKPNANAIFNLHGLLNLHCGRIVFEEFPGFVMGTTQMGRDGNWIHHTGIYTVGAA